MGRGKVGVDESLISGAAVGQIYSCTHCVLPVYMNGVHSFIPARCDNTLLI